MKKILFIRFSSIGDIVLCTPAIRCTKKQVHNCVVHFFTKLSYKEVTEENPYIDKFFYFDENLDDIIEQLKKEEYDYVIDLQNNFRSEKVKRSLKAKPFTIDKLSIQKFILTKTGINLMPKRHISLRCLDAVSSLNVNDDGQGLDFFIHKKYQIGANDLPYAQLFGFIAIVIGGSYKTKKLPLQKLKELCEKIAYPVILLGDKTDFETAKEIAAIDDVRIYNACGKFTLAESASILEHSKLVISHDTGLLYIACALNKPTFAVWGSTSPLLNVEPFYGNKYLKSQKGEPFENIIVSPKLSCQPCNNYGSDECPKKHFKCMENQDVALIASMAIKRVLG